MSDLVKSLTQLIDETLLEIETLKKGRFEAEEIELGDKKANGEMVAKKEDEEKEDEKEEEKTEKAEDKKEFADKDHKHDIECKVVKADEEDKEDEDDEEDEMEKAEMECAKAEEAFKAACAKRDAMKKGVLEEKDSKEEIKKSIDARVQPIEAKLEEITNLVKKLADSPVPARGSTFKSIQPLAKSEDSQPLSKSKVLEELVTLKKSGKPVTSEDVLRAELGGLQDIEEIATKYGIK
jgi:hypothetical protein